MPTDLNNDADIKQHEQVAASGKLGLVNPNGTVARFVDFAPTTIRNTGMMHRTQSLDYGIVIEGRMIMELDDGSKTLMKRGDVAVQRATNHSWLNASDTEWARDVLCAAGLQATYHCWSEDEGGSGRGKGDLS